MNAARLLVDALVGDRLSKPHTSDERSKTPVLKKLRTTAPPKQPTLGERMSEAALMAAFARHEIDAAVQDLQVAASVQCDLAQEARSEIERLEGLAAFADEECDIALALAESIETSLAAA